MQSYSERLQTLKDNIDGAVVTCFVGYDGLSIAQCGKLEGMDVDLVVASLASVTTRLKSSYQEVYEMICTFSKNMIFIKTFDDGFLCIVMSLDGNIGRAKLETKKLGRVFAEA